MAEPLKSRHLYNSQSVPFYIPMFDTSKSQELPDQPHHHVFMNNPEQISFQFDHIEKSNKRNDSKTTSVVEGQKITSVVEGQSFPFRLWYLVDSEAYNDVIEWSPDGNYVVIPSEKEFEKRVLLYPIERVFKTSSMKSFVRQLNLYGFHKVQLGKDKNFLYLHSHDKSKWPEAVFMNVTFKRSRFDLLDTIKRRCKVKQYKWKENIKKCIQHQNSASEYSCPLHEINNRKGVYIQCFNQLENNQPIMIQFPNVLPSLENSLNSGNTVSSVRRNLHVTGWSPSNSSTSSNALNQSKEDVVMENSIDDEEPGTSKEKEKLANPLAVFCASLFKEDHSEMFRICDE